MGYFYYKLSVTAEAPEGEAGDAALIGKLLLWLLLLGLFKALLDLLANGQFHFHGYTLTVDLQLQYLAYCCLAHKTY